MQIKSNLDLLERLNIATKLINQSMNILLSKDKHGDPDDPKPEQFGRLSQKQSQKMLDKLSDAWLAVKVPVLQARRLKTEKYIHFPHQDKKLKQLFGNRHCTKITRVEKHGDKLILTLGHTRKAMTAYIDILNDQHYRKNVNTEAYLGDVRDKHGALIPRGNFIPKDCPDPVDNIKHGNNQ